MTEKCIITFTGPVGVGKSTQIKLLRSYFLLNKNKVVMTFIKSNHLLAYLMIRFLKLMGRKIDERLFIILYLLDMISILVKFFFTVYIPFHLGFTIIMEEGPIMTLFTYVVRYPKFNNIKLEKPSFILRMIGWISKQKNINIILNAEEDELIRRRKNRKYRQYESSEYVRLQKKWLNQISNHLSNTIFIETTKLSAIQTHKLIITEIERRMQREY